MLATRPSPSGSTALCWKCLGDIVVGLCFGFYHAASPDFRILNWWLACKGKVPWRFRRFLDDAHQKTVLRQAGASYEFRHVILRDRLAARLEEDQ